MQPAIPAPLKAEHEELHQTLAHAARAGGLVGDAAQEVAKVLHPHFVKEEEFALPPLGLLAAVARGETPSPEASRAAGAMAERLKAELRGMLAEHGRIVAALDGLASAAAMEGRHDLLRFVEALKTHARTEEEVLYPATLLLGEKLRGGAR
jgi:hypothetical protein